MGRTIRHTVRIMGALALLAGCASVTPPPPVDYVWPSPPDPPRIRYIGSLWRSDQFGSEQPGFLSQAFLGGAAARSEGMAKPLAVTSDARGRVYVTDTGGGRVWVFDSAAKKVRYLGDSGPSRLLTPTGVAVDARGIVFVADSKHRKIFGYDETGKIAVAIGKPDELGSPSGLVIDRATQRLYVADTGKHVIRVYDAGTGEFVSQFGKRGPNPGDLNYPTHLALGGGELYVTDTMNFRVQVFTLDGTYVRKYGEMGAALGQLARPKGVAVDSEGHVYIVDAAFNNFQIFDRTGALLLFVGRLGLEAGEFYLPAGMHIDAQDRIYVVDQYNRRVQVFQYLPEGGLARTGSPTSGTTP
jgi:DNA-binding beta-propeller fold protein YncE